MEVVHNIREIEEKVIRISDSFNEVLKIQEYLIDHDQPFAVVIAAFHSLRRIFTSVLKNDLTLLVTNIKNNSVGIPTDGLVLDKDRQFILNQYLGFRDVLYSWIESGDINKQVPSIRCILEFILIESSSKQIDILNGNQGNFKMPFQCLFEKLCNASELDVELLLLLREEVFDKLDCCFFALTTIKLHLQNIKRIKKKELILSSTKIKKSQIALSSSSSSSKSTELNVEKVVNNVIDILRMITPPDVDDITKGEVLCQCYEMMNDEDDEGEEEEDDDSQSGSDSDEAIEKNENIKASKQKQKLPLRKRKLNKNDTEFVPKKRTKISRSQQIFDKASHLRVYSKAWLMLLSMPLTNAQHKLVLKHLPHHVLPYFIKPLLLSDYLTNCYNHGGILAVLALESLFNLIVNQNLDYPHFFPSLYRLCTVDVLSARYRAKFMNLLQMSLKSSNLPAYLVASFIKRLARLALHCSSPGAMFCLAQVTWLLRHHPQCMVLVHRDSSSSNISGVESDPFNPKEETNLEKTRALESSLWEASALQHHHLHSVAVLARALQNEVSTSNDPNTPALIVSDFINHSYADIISLELKNGLKKNSALAFKEPIQLVSQHDFIGEYFGP